MKHTLLFLFTLIHIGFITNHAQGTLQFNRVITLSNTPETVPANKVWKVTAVYGQEIRINECVDYSSTSTHEVGALARCGSSGLPTTISSRFNYSIRGIILNSTPIAFSLNGFGTCPSSSQYITNNCSGSTYGCNHWSSNPSWNCVNMPNDPNILPIWLPAAATLQTMGSKTFASVIEFNIIP
jgi:hypothetical protein